MTTKTLRLNKVLRELNISLDRAIEHLHSEGFNVEARSTTKITDKEYQILLDKFQTDRSKKVASIEIGEEKKKEKEAIIEQSISKTEAKKEEVLKAKAKKLEIKQVGKIDIDPKPKPAKEKTPVKKEVEEKKEEEIKIEGKEAKKEKEIKVEESVDKIEKSPEKMVPTEGTIPQEKEKDGEKEETPKEDSTNQAIETKYQKLDGPKMTGQVIDLKEFEKKKEAPKKGVAKESDATKEANKRKRIRIRKPSPPTPQKKSNLRGSRQGQGQNNKVVKEELSDAEVQRQVKETLDKLQGKSKKGKASKYRKEKRDTHKQQKDLELQEADKKVLKLTEFVTVNELSTMMNTPIGEVISACMSLGLMVTMNQRLDAETLSIVAEEFEYEVDFISSEIEEATQEEEDDKENLEKRPPIITIMGHVDHGKTSLLDFIREENVIAGESGGITQHIGAYQVTIKNGESLTFLDTPGHEAFTAMRARGAQVTDIAIIVISADDEIMPQTKEAISHAQAANVPMIFAINKIDKPDANPDRIKEQLSAMNLLVEDWGGKFQSQNISAKNGDGVDELLEKVLLESELLELKANPNRRAGGTVIEASLDKGRGYVTTVLVQDGTLNIGDYMLAGKHSGKVKAMFDERGKTLKTAKPSTPISILGLDGASQAGDKFIVFEDEREAKQIATKRSQLQREQTVRTHRHITLDEIGRRIAIGDFKELNIILKGDVDGSVEALADSFQKLSTEEIIINIIHKGVGAITESDVLLASTSDAIIIGFNVRPSGNARSIAEKEEIDIRTYSIIYDAINDLRDAMEGLLSPEMKEEVTGTVEIREVYKISKIGNIAGCMVLTGKIFRNSKIRLLREDVVVFSGELSSLKRFKDDAKEVAKGYDCGLQVKDYNNIQVGDVLEAYHEIQVKKKLK